MKTSYFDTSVLLPIFVALHPNHQKCLALLEQSLNEGHVVSTTIHTYAELFSNLTKLPFGLSISPNDAALAIIDRLGEIIKPIDLSRSDYEAALDRCAERNLSSGIIYDALHLQAAIKSNADVLYTANLRDFERLYSKDLGFALKGIEV